MNMKFPSPHFYFKPSNMLMLAACAWFSSGAAAVEGYFLIEATINKPVSAFYKYNDILECEWSFSDVDSAGNRVIGADCTHKLIPPDSPSKLASKVDSFTANLELHAKGSVLTVTDPGLGLRNNAGTYWSASYFTEQDGTWHETLTTIDTTTEDTRGLCLGLGDKKREIICSDGSVDETQEPLTYSILIKGLNINK